MGFVVAIDGVSGAGKGYVAKSISEKYGLVNIDTGAMYRALGLYIVNNNVDLADTKKICEMLDKIEMHFVNQNIYINDTNYEAEIRNEQVGKYAAIVSSIPYVRQQMVLMQRNMASNIDVVMEGRDITSVVFPNADLKIFMTASSLERAKRRQIDLKAKGIDVPIDELEKEMIVRDKIDFEKKISPLVKVEDAVEIDTTELSREQVVDRVYNLLKERGYFNGKRV